MTAFTANQTFRDGYETFEEGQSYDEPQGRVARFVAAGWADSPELDGGEPVNVDANPTLAVDDAAHDQSTENPGA